MSLTRALVLVAVVAVLLGTLIVPISRHQDWVGLHRQIEAKIRQLVPTPPGSNNTGSWDCAHGWVITGYANICFAPGYVTTAEMRRLRDDLEAKVAGKVDLETLRWLWGRLGETGPNGKSYVERLGPSFLECFPPSA